MMTLKELVESLQLLDQDLLIESMDMIDVDGQEYAYSDLNYDSDEIDE